MTLLSMVGEDITRIVPLLFAYKNTIKHHVLLCDDAPSNYERARTLKEGMTKFSKKNGLKWEIQIVSIDEDSAHDIAGVAKKYFTDAQDIWLNATDGYPAMTVLLSDFVRQKGGKVLSYDHFDNDLHIIDAEGHMTAEKLSARMDIESYLTLLNYSIVTERKKEHIFSRKEAVMTLFKDFSRFKKIKDRLVYPETSTADLHYFTDLLDALEVLGIVDKDHQFIASEKKMLEGDLLEEYVFWLCESLNPDDISVSIEIEFVDSKTEPDIIKRVNNEFDVLLMHKNRLFTIECKNRKNLVGLDEIYKYDAIIDYFGHASKAILVNVSNVYKEKYIGMHKSKNFSHSTLRRARLAGVHVYHETQINVIKFQNLVQNFFHLS